MAYDIALVVFVAAGFFFGWRKGLIFSLISLLAIFIGIFGVMRFSGAFAEMVSENTDLAEPLVPIVSSILVFLLFFFTIRLTGWVLDQFLKAMMLGFVNKLAGGLLFGIVLLITFSVLTWLFDYGGYLPKSLQQESSTYVYIIQLAPLLYDLVGQVLPFMQGLFDSLQDAVEASPQPTEAA